MSDPSSPHLGNQAAQEQIRDEGSRRSQGLDPLVSTIKALFAEGLQTHVEPFPESDVEFGAILDELRALDRDDLEAKLKISGWKLSPHGEDQMRCQECMYYLVHKRWCDLPELNLPAEPHWWCRLWRI